MPYSLARFPAADCMSMGSSDLNWSSIYATVVASRICFDCMQGSVACERRCCPSFQGWRERFLSATHLGKPCFSFLI